MTERLSMHAPHVVDAVHAADPSTAPPTAVASEGGRDTGGWGPQPRTQNAYFASGQCRGRLYCLNAGLAIHVFLSDKIRDAHFVETFIYLLRFYAVVSPLRGSVSSCTFTQRSRAGLTHFAPSGAGVSLCRRYCHCIESCCVFARDIAHFRPRS